LRAPTPIECTLPSLSSRSEKLKARTPSRVRRTEGSRRDPDLALIESSSTPQDLKDLGLDLGVNGRADRGRDGVTSPRRAQPSGVLDDDAAVQQAPHGPVAQANRPIEDKLHEPEQAFASKL
jgi:hypothetical protein